MAAQKLTTSEVCEMLGVGAMTIYNYRMGRAATKTPLPFHVEPRGSRHSVVFKLHEVVRWAKKNGVEVQAP